MLAKYLDTNGGNAEKKKLFFSEFLFVDDCRSVKHTLKMLTKIFRVKFLFFYFFQLEQIRKNLDIPPGYISEWDRCPPSFGRKRRSYLPYFGSSDYVDSEMAFAVSLSDFQNIELNFNYLRK